MLGGGFGGLAGAHELRRQLDDDHEVVVVDRADGFFMGFAKLWDLSGFRPLAESTRSRSRLAHHGIRWLQADVRRIDPATRTVETSRETLRPDAVLIALGAGPAAGHRTLLASDGAYDLYDPAELGAIRGALDRVASGRVVVSILGGPFKCPPAPYEAALIVDRHLRERGVRDDVEVVLTTPQPMTIPAAGVDASRYVADHLGDVGVELRPRTTVVAVDGEQHRVRFEDGDELDYDVLLGVPADTLPPVLEDAGLAGDRGWIEVDRHTLRTAADGVYAVGDCTWIPTAAGALPHAGVFAAGQAEVAARNIAADLGVGDGDRFDGHGYCFLELPDEQVAFVQGDFYADPLDVTLTPADREQFERKLAFERERLDAWLG